MTRTRARWATALVMIFGACASIAVPSSGTRAQASGARTHPETIGGARGDYRVLRFHVPLDRARLRIADLGMRTELASLLSDRVALAINGGFFDLAGSPEGLAISSGRTLSPLDRSLSGGFISVMRGRATLHDAENDPVPGGDIDFAIQCRPRLVVDRRVNIRSDDGQRANRTALCIRDGGSALDVIIARGDLHRTGPTLLELATQLQQMGCEQALNLDGGPSTGLAWRDADGIHHEPPRAPIRHAIAVELTERSVR